MKEWLKIAPDLPAVLDAVYKDCYAGEVCPPAHFVTRALELVPPEDVKVVILGQDPYYTPEKANGLAFGYNREYRGPIDSSMANILGELQLPHTKYSCSGFDLTLEHWAAQGVLLLNTRLTTLVGRAMAHGNLAYEKPISDILKYLGTRSIVWLCWGREARIKAEAANPYPGHVICTSHPSALSATKGPVPFRGSNCFNMANKLLAKMGRRTINWTGRGAE